MLRETVMEWTREWKNEGWREGRREGRREGVANILARQLELKFGPLKPENQARIDGADAERLLAWGERVLTARSLEEVFSD